MTLPLHPTDTLSTERRESPRHANLQETIGCRVKSERIQPDGGQCELVDISHTGFGVTSLDKLPAGEDVKLDIEYQGKRLNDADAFVAYCHYEEDHYRIGLVLNFRSNDMLGCEAYNFLNDILNSVQR